jgi:MarR family transcriptional regulator, negative regulator of the multidrug operon emrRAB
MHTSTRAANLLGALGIVLSDALSDAAEPAGGTTTATALVALAGPSAGASIDALAGVVGLSHSGTVRLVDRLVADGLAERRRGADQRSAALVLTPAGRRATGQVLRRREANIQSTLALLTEDQQAAVVEIAERVLGELGADRDAESRVCRLCDLEACGRPQGTCPTAPARRRRHAAARR